MWMSTRMHACKKCYIKSTENEEGKEEKKHMELMGGLDEVCFVDFLYGDFAIFNQEI